LEERGVAYETLRLFGGAHSAGSTIETACGPIVVEPLDGASLAGIDIALFSAGGSVSKEWAPRFAEAGAVVIDNSSYWRMHDDVPLVVPEVNAADALQHKGIIANPNCSTIQLVVALWPLHNAVGIRRLVVSTYQSVSGAGMRGVGQLSAEIAGREPLARISSHPLAFNTVFHSISQTDGASEEEQKMLRETRRIMHLPDLRMAVTCVRVPVLGGHGESVAVETTQPCTPAQARDILAHAPGVVVVDDPANDAYPTVRLAEHTDDVQVGRIRTDPSVDRGLLLWVVADNLRKGAATNAVQIAEYLIATT
ncbi:MAG: aspartate-semialdehyde dehydrogenase, partial [Candidatus Kapabacteria bacterium]|nr:aspartate-semialdehyde dehydrogenase [Candidatus Kapabacteria bacterium]